MMPLAAAVPSPYFPVMALLVMLGVMCVVLALRTERAEGTDSAPTDRVM